MEWKRMIYQGKDLGDYYLISDEGNIKNAKTGKIRKLSKVGTGYTGCTLSLGSRKNKKVIRVHKAVAETFISNPDNKPEVNHIDGNKDNNVVSNLEWVTSKENTAHAIKNKLRNEAYGERAGASKLTQEQVSWIRSVYIPRDKIYGSRAIGRKLGIDHTTILSAIKRETWNKTRV